MTRPLAWTLLGVVSLWAALTAAQLAVSPPAVPQWIGIALTVVLSGLVPVGWYGVTLYRGHARELEEVRSRVSVLEQELYGKTGGDGLKRRLDQVAERTHAVPSIRQMMEWLEQTWRAK